MTSDLAFTPRVLVLTGLAMIAFAANSILCRLALGRPGIDAGTFTMLRLVSGAITLLAMSRLSGRERTARCVGPV